MSDLPYRNTVPCDWCKHDEIKAGRTPLNDATHVLGKPLGDDWKFVCSGEHWQNAIIGGFYPQLLPLEPTFENTLLRGGKQ